MKELGEKNFELEVGYAFDQRVRLCPKLQSSPATKTDWSALESGGAWIVSGGATGITAFCARNLALHHGMTLHLLGRTPSDPLPQEWLTLSQSNWNALREEVMKLEAESGQTPKDRWELTKRRIEIDQNLKANAAAGLRSFYHCVDIRDRANLREVIDRIRQQGQPIRGLIHGAGIEFSCRFVKKEIDVVRATLFSKIVGLHNLLQLVPGDQLSAVVGFGSISGRFGGRGQADYSSASEFLAKLLADYRRQIGVRCTTFHWPPWASLGMATRAESRFALRKAGWNFLTPEQGFDMFLRELEAGLPESEVLVMEPLRGSQELNALSEDSSRIHGPLGLREISRSSKKIIAEMVFDSEKQPFLKHHQLDGRPLVPIAISLEAALEAARSQLSVRGPWRFQNIRMISPLSLSVGGQLKTTIRVRSASPVTHIEMFAVKPEDPSGTMVRKRRSLGAELWGEARRNTRPVRVPPDFELLPVSYPENSRVCRPGQIFHGPSFRALRMFRRWSGTSAQGLLVQGGWGEIHLCDEALLPSAADGWGLSPSGLDSCLMACGIWLFSESGDFSLPVGLEEFYVVAEIPKKLSVFVTCREKNATGATFDFRAGNATDTFMEGRGLQLRTVRAKN